MNLNYYKEEDVKNKRVFIRVDFNVPIKNKTIQDNFKIISSIPTILNVYKFKPLSLTIGSHLGRPNGKYTESLSMYPVYLEFKKLISKYLKISVLFLEIENYKVNENSIIFLENLRFYKEEENDVEGTQLKIFFQRNIDIVVIDAFGCLHRNNYSITKTSLPSYCGDLVSKELEIGNEVLQKGIDLLILGGSKVSDKIKMIESLVPKCKSIFLVGKLSQEFLKCVLNKDNDSSTSEHVILVNNLCKEHNVKLHLPKDYEYKSRNIDVSSSKKIIGKDIGEKTIVELRGIINEHRNIFWNGPPGVFEEDEHATGTKKLVQMLESHEGNVIVGGGETSYSVRKFSDVNKFYHVSTGGGAFIKLLSGERLPGIEALKIE